MSTPNFTLTIAVRHTAVQISLEAAATIDTESATWPGNQPLHDQLLTNWLRLLKERSEASYAKSE